MARQDTISMHYVPRTYLKRFGEKRGKHSFVHRISVLSPSEVDIKEVNVQSLCAKDHLYTMPGKTVEERMLIEDLYSGIFDTQYDRIYKILTDSSITTISEEDRSLIISTVTSMFFRNNAWNVFQNDITSSIIESGYRQSIEGGKEHFFINDEKIDMKGKTLAEVKAAYNQKHKATLNVTQFNAALKLLNIRQQSDIIMVIKIKGNDWEYVTSDRPVICYNKNNSHIVPIDPSNILTMPLDAKHRLCLRPIAEEESHKLNIYRIPGNDVLDKGEFLLANYFQASSTAKSIFGSKKGLEQYVKYKSYFERA